MSRLSLPTATGLAQGTITLPVVLPVEAVDRDATMSVLPMHVVYRRPGGFRTQASTHIPYAEYTDGASVLARPLGVSLDYIPYEDAMLPRGSGSQILAGSRLEDQSLGARSFSVAVAGVVPVAVPSSAINKALLGDSLYIVPFAENDPNYKHFGDPRHRVGMFSVQNVPGALKIGTIVGLGADYENHCLVRLSLH